MPSLKHKIDIYIIDQLIYTHVARFRDLRPVKTDTNLFTYHLNSLVKSNLVNKVEGGYTLGTAGLAYVDRVSAGKQPICTQPKILTMLLVQNSEGDILLQRRHKQPYIDTWTLPYGKIHGDDLSVLAVAERQARMKLGVTDQTLRHVGDCYIRVSIGGEMVSATLAHIVAFNCDSIVISDELMWARPHKLHQYALAPAVEAIVARGFFNDPFFFEEFNVTWTL